MDARVSVVDTESSSAELRSLLAWLRREEGLRSVQLKIDGKTAEGEMGLDTEVLTALLGPAGSGAALVTAIGAWLSTRRKVRLKVEGPKGTIEFEASDLERVEVLLDRVGDRTGLVGPDEAS